MKVAYTTLCVACFYVLSLNLDFANGELVVKVKNGTLEGIFLKTRKGREYAAFRGIPYALPPIGELRFQPPRPAASWAGVRSAKEDAGICVQRNIYTYQEEIVGVEDCLYLNVYSPILPTSPPGLDNPHPALPVLVWFHGGGWVTGAGHSDFYSAKFLLDHDVILVTLNFRLGPLGFLSTEDLVSPGNQGMKDQSQALRWVQENIYAFGGDPNRVTIFGESAGGASVNYHMMSPLSRGLFHRGISESGTALCPWALTRPGLGINQARRLGQLLGCVEEDTSKLLECLRTKDALDIIGTDRDFQQFGYCPMIPFRPIVEPNHPGAFLTEDPAAALKAGHIADIPWMTGVTSHEGALRAAGVYGLNNSKDATRLNDDFQNIAPITFLYDHYCAKDVRSEVTKRIREFYFGDLPVDNSTKWNLIDLYSDAWFNVAADNTIRDFLDFQSSPVFYYYFAYQGEVSFSTIFGDESEDYGVSHADELQYLFPVGEQLFKDKTLGDESLKVVEIITSFWANFAKSGNPTPEVTDAVPVKWQPVRTHNLEYLHIGGSKDLFMAYNLLPERMQFWASLPLQGLSYSEQGELHRSKDEFYKNYIEMDDDDPRQDEAMMEARARMFGPLVWETNPDFVIQSLKDTRYDEAINLIKHHFVKEDPMCASIDFSEDRSSLNRFFEILVTRMKDSISICALSSRTSRLVGVAVMRVNALVDKAETYDRIQLLKGEALPKIMELENALVKQAKIYDALNVANYLRIYNLTVHPSYESKAVKSALIEAAISVGRSLKSPYIFGIFTSKADQDVARSLNLEIFSEILYSRWIVDDDVVFADPGIGNYSAALMGISVPEDQPDEQIKNRRNSWKSEKHSKKCKTPGQYRQ